MRKWKIMKKPHWILWKIAPKASNMPSQDVWKFTPVSYRTSALWGRCPAHSTSSDITPSRASGTAGHVRSLDDLSSDIGLMAPYPKSSSVAPFPSSVPPHRLHSAMPQLSRCHSFHSATSNTSDSHKSRAAMSRLPWRFLALTTAYLGVVSQS